MSVARSARCMACTFCSSVLRSATLRPLAHGAWQLAMELLAAPARLHAPGRCKGAASPSKGGRPASLAGGLLWGWPQVEL